MPCSQVPEEHWWTPTGIHSVMSQKTQLFIVTVVRMVYNGLPYDLKANSSYPKKFKANLKDFLYTNSFYSMEEFFNR
jgi:hypothetical protein